MKKEFMLAVTLLLSISGCRSNRRFGTPKINTNVDVPVEESRRSFFDDDMNEFNAEEMMDTMRADAGIDPMDSSTMDVALYEPMEEFTWSEEDNQQTSFKTVYFDWDSEKIREDQHDVVRQNADLAKQIIAECESMGMPRPTFVIDGHASSAGTASESYKVAISEKRAQALADYLVEQGVSSDCIQVVGRGSQMPAIIEGKVVEGDRQEQWANRRDEIRVIYA